MARYFWPVSLLLPLALLICSCQPVTPQVIPDDDTESTVNDLVALESLISDTSRVLCLGDVEIEANWGVCAHLAGMAASAEPPITIEAETIVKTWLGTGLETETIGAMKDLWMQDDVRERLKTGDWDVVVLYENLPREAYLVVKEGLQEENPQDYPSLESNFVNYSQLLINEIEQNGGNAVVLVPWSHPMEAAGDIEIVPSVETLVETVNQVVADNSAIRAPTGPAFIRSNENYPEIKLFESFDSHSPSIEGIYLDAAILYILLVGRSPVGIDYLPVDILPDNAAGDLLREYWEMPEDTAVILQQIAWDTVQAYLVAE